MYVCYREFKEQVRQQVFLVIQGLFPTLSETEFNELFEADEWVAFMKRDIYLRYQLGEVPFLKVDSEKVEFVLGIVSSMKDTLDKRRMLVNDKHSV